MARASRKDRKEQRGRAQRATDRGLPAALPDPKVFGGASQDVVLARADTNWSAADGPNASVPAKPKGFAAIPTSIKVVGLATLLLLGFSLWRTLSAR